MKKQKKTKKQDKVCKKNQEKQRKYFKKGKTKQKQENLG